MKVYSNFRSVFFAFAIAVFTIVTVAVSDVSAQNTSAALHRGYRTGYSDGYMAGYRDSIDNIAKDPVKHGEYAEAKRAYNKDYGTIEDYSDGYRQGFETGYSTGFDKLSFESAVPAGLSRRGNVPVPMPATPSTEVIAKSEPVGRTEIPVPPVTNNVPEPAVEPARSESQPVSQPATPVAYQKANYIADQNAIIIIPRDTELIIEIDGTLDTEKNSVGDKFTARIVSPSEIDGAILEGRIDRIVKPGRIKRRAEMLLSFDRIIISEERWANFDAVLTEVLPIKGDNVKMVDNEGTAVGQRTLKADAIKVGASTGAGIGIGAITAGPVGAAVGAGVGAAFGVGAVVIERGKHIHLNTNQQLRIRTSYEVKIR